MKKIIMILAVLGLMVAPSMAAISYVTGGSIGEPLVDAAGSQTLSSFAAGSGNYVVVGFAMKSNANTDNTPLTGITYGGVAMTFLGLSHADDSAWDCYSYLYGIASTSASGDIVASWTIDTAASGFDGTALTASSWSGVTGIGVVSGGSTKFGSNTGDEFSDTITGVSADSVVVSSWALGANSTAMSSVDSTIQVQEPGSGFNAGALLSQDVAIDGDITSTLTWTDVNSRRASSISVELVPEPATVGMLGLGALVALLVRRMRA